MKTCTFAALALAALLVACGGGDPPPTTPTVVSPPPPAPVSNIVTQGNGSLGSKILGPVPFTTTQAGTLSVTVDWTFPSNDVDLFVVRGTDPCTVATFNNRTCAFLSTAESATQKPERLTINSLPAGAYTLYVANFGATDESVAWQVVLTTGGTGSSRSTSGSGGSSGTKGPLHGILALR